MMMVMMMRHCEGAAVLAQTPMSLFEETHQAYGESSL